MPATVEKDLYLSSFEEFERSIANTDPAWYRPTRNGAIARVSELGFPGPKHEEWWFTPLSGLLSVSFTLPPAEVSERGQSHWSADNQTLPAGAIVCTLAEALVKHSGLLERYLARHADNKGQVFTALNTAFLRDGLFVFIPAGKVIEGPIYLDFEAMAGASPHVWYRRCLVIAGANSQATVVERYTGPDGSIYWTNAVTEVVLGQNAVVDHYKIQREGDAAYHLATMQVQLERSAHFSSHSITLGGQWVRNEANAVFNGEGGECTLNGLYHARGRQLIDNHTTIDHARAHCNSHELYKGLLEDKAHGVFNGKIFVRPDAQKTDAKQTNQTLLLSDDATIDTKPQLEIFADDVKCTHGATIGQLDENHLFYLRSRGIGTEQARRLLLYAFANDIIQRIKIPTVRAQLEDLFLTSQHLPRIEESEEQP